MDYEKKYKEALELARDYYKANIKLNKADENLVLEDIFPELKESEDERIRKDIIWCLKHSGIKESGPINPHVTTITKDAIAWLEKQGGQKETLCDKCKKAQPSHSCQDITALGRCYIENINTSTNKVEPKSQRMVSAEAKEAMYGKPANEEMIEALRTEYEKGRADAIAEMQVAWSEEDDITRKALINLVEMFYGYCIDKSEKNRLLDWLKSLKNRCTWKPSDEQMDTLLSEVTAWTKGCPKQKVLESLYNDLKKLKGE